MNFERIAAFEFVAEIDEDEEDNGIEYKTEVEIFADENRHTLEAVFEDKTYNGIAWWRVHNFMAQNKIYDQLGQDAADNTVVQEFSVDGKRHVRLSV
jgi:hypothetical protein